MLCFRLLRCWPNLVRLDIDGLAIDFPRNSPSPVGRLPQGLRHLRFRPESEAACSLFRDIILASQTSLESVRVHSLNPGHDLDFTNVILPALQPVAAQLSQFFTATMKSPDVLQIVESMVRLTTLGSPTVEPHHARTPTLQILRRLPCLRQIFLFVHTATINFTAPDLVEYFRQNQSVRDFWMCAGNVGDGDTFNPRREWDADELAAVELAAKEAGINFLLLT